MASLHTLGPTSARFFGAKNVLFFWQGLQKMSFLAAEKHHLQKTCTCPSETSPNRWTKDRSKSETITKRDHFNLSNSFLKVTLASTQTSHSSSNSPSTWQAKGIPAFYYLWCLSLPALSVASSTKMDWSWPLRTLSFFGGGGVAVFITVSAGTSFETHLEKRISRTSNVEQLAQSYEYIHADLHGYVPKKKIHKGY